MFEPKKKFVRVTNVRDEKYIEFDFSFDDPEIFVELILPIEMFETFCKKNKVEFLETDKVIENEYEQQVWRMGHSRKKVFKK